MPDRIWMWRIGWCAIRGDLWATVSEDVGRWLMGQGQMVRCDPPLAYGHWDGPAEWK